METVRLLRSQLRNKGIMRVIDADTLPLLEVAKQNSGDANTPPVPDQQAVHAARRIRTSRRSSTTKKISSRTSTSSRTSRTGNGSARNISSR